jgi:hypothetical protein
MSTDISDVSSVSDLSSVPSSPRSTPELESRYPTPSSSQDAEDLPSTRQDCPPAKKKRRRNPLPKERTTQHLSFSKSSEDQQDQVRLLFDTLRYQKDIVVIAGAGISTSAGSKFFMCRFPVLGIHSNHTQHSIAQPCNSWITNHLMYSSGLSIRRWPLQVSTAKAQFESFWKAPL